ncbi:MAG: DedA family protein, partial [Chlamydiales bacterium]|nr:DedA family protein [Chlamydiales bacterium]
LLGGRLQKMKWFSKLLAKEKIEKVRHFYEKYGILTLILGRFIPFGVRNCIFMTTGLSKLSFLRFALMDALACFLWCSISFYTFYSIGHNFQIICGYLKTFNLFVFSAFAVAGISIIWYKIRKKIVKTTERDSKEVY